MPVLPFDPATGGGGAAGPVALPMQVLVGAKSDLPAPSGGVITLAADTEYLFIADVSVGTDRLALSANTLITAQDSSLATLTYTGTGNMFTAVGVNNKIARITLMCASGTLLNIDGSGTAIFQLFDLTIVSAASLGTLTALSGAQITNVAVISMTTTGLLFTGAHGIFIASDCLFTLDAGTLFDLGTATFDGFSFTNSFPNIASGATMISGAASSANLNSGGFATIQNIIMEGAGTALSGITVDDAQWQFSLNSDIKDTRPDAWISMPTLTTTTIAVATTPVLVAGTWNLTAPNRSSQFTITAAGRATYDGVKDATLQVDISTTMKMDSGSNKAVKIHLFKNGSAVTNAFGPNTVGSSTFGNTSVAAQISFVNGDFIELFVSNEDDTVDININKADIRIN